MKVSLYLFLYLTLLSRTVSGQSADDLKNGYALKGRDTIWCKVRFNSKIEHGSKAVTLLFNNEEATFYPGGPITGFGVNDKETTRHYGTVDVEVSVANRSTNSFFYVEKLVAGTIDLYEYSYSIYSTTRRTVDGIEKPGSATSNSQRFTNHYIAKTDSLNPALATPVLLSSFRKKDLEPYISDNAAMVASTEKKFSQKEFMALIKEYNNWYSEKKKQR